MAWNDLSSGVKGIVITTLVMLGVCEAILNVFYLFNQACSKYMDIQVVAGA